MFQPCCDDCELVVTSRLDFQVLVVDLPCSMCVVCDLVVTSRLKGGKLEVQGVLLGRFILRFMARRDKYQSAKLSDG